MNPFRRIFAEGADDGVIGGFAHIGHNDRARQLDPGLDQSQRIGVVSRESLLDNEPINPNRGLRGTYVEKVRGYTQSPQQWAAVRESQAAPPPTDGGFGYVATKNPIVSDE